MPSPFPGMDPYLENLGLWPDVHHELISVAREILGAMLRPKYTVRIEERVYLTSVADPGRTVLVPDLRISERPLARPGGELRFHTGIEVVEPIATITLIENEIRESRLEVVDREQHQIVAVIELLSPSNKVAGSNGRESFRQKRIEITNSPSHWIEIDLLRAGLPLDVAERLPPHEYLVHVSEASRRPRGLLWPIRLDQRLPVIPIPLKPEDPTASLDLQVVLNQAYERANYDLSIDYRSDPVPPLSAEWAEWADRRLREQGFRGEQP